MSGTYPSDPQPREVEIRSVTTTLVSMGQSMKRQARTRNAQRWSLKFTYPPLSRDEWAPIFAFLMKQRGRYETFQVVLPPPLYTPQGIATGSPVVNNQAGSPEQLQTGLRSVVTKGWTVGQTGIVKAADFLLYAGHTKIYMATADANSDGSGNATITQEPALIEGPAHNAVITINSPAFTVALANDSLESALSINPQFGFSVEMLEAY